MTDRKNKTARTVAAEVLNRCDLQKDYAGAILDKLLSQTSQRQRATDLVFGSIRNRIAIDTVIEKFSGRRIDRISPKLLNIIRIGVYELVYSPSTKEYSIVNEAVENVKALTGKKQVGFVNAVLREILRHIKNRQIELQKAPIAGTIVQSPSAGCEFDTDFLPDCDAEPAEYLSTVFSLPKWLVDGWLEEFGFEQTREICMASNRRPSIYLRPNTLITTVEELTEKLRGENVDCEIAEETMIQLKSPKSVNELPGFNDGLFVVQDITASQPVRLLNPQSGWKILDLCAAPGTKTAQLAEVTGDSASIIATDINENRLKMVADNVGRLNINSVEIIPYREIQKSKFDCILLDVPCSNTGVLAKRIEVRYRIKPEAIEGLAKTQRELLETAATLLKPQGSICYCTCSIQKSENSELVTNFLQNNPDFKLKIERLILQSAEGFDHDGGYAAVITR